MSPATPGADGGDLPVQLDHLVAVLADAAALIPRAGGPDPERLMGMLEDARAAFRRAAGAVAVPCPAGGPLPDAMAEWLHDLRARVGAIAGWVRFLSQQRDEATWVRAADVVERNVKFLAELLAHPPG